MVPSNTLPKLFALNVAIFLGILFALLVFFEAYVRSIDPSPSTILISPPFYESDATVVWKHRTNFAYRYLDATTSFDQFGDRSVYEADALHHLLIVGDSFAFGA